MRKQRPMEGKYLPIALRKNDGLGTTSQVSDISPSTALLHRLPFTGNCLPPPAQDSNMLSTLQKDTIYSTHWPRKVSTDTARSI